MLNHAPGDLKPLELLVLVALAESAHDTDRTAIKDSSADAIAYRVRSTPGSVRNVLVKLRMRGLIRPVHSKVHKGQTQNWIVAHLSSHHREAQIRPDPDDP